MSTRVNQKKIKSSRKENVMCTYFTLWPMKKIFRKLKANESLVMTCLQAYRESLSPAIFLRVHANSKEISYLSWQNRYPNLKTASHMKLNIFLWTKLLKYLLVVKSVTATLSHLEGICFIRKRRLHFFQ